MFVVWRSYGIHMSLAVLDCRLHSTMILGFCYLNPVFATMIFDHCVQKMQVFMFNMRLVLWYDMCMADSWNLCLHNNLAAKYWINDTKLC